MQLRTLQQFLRSLAEPLAQCHAPEDSVRNLRQAADLLNSLGDLTLAQFAELLRQAKEYQDTKELAVPRYLQPIVSCYDSVRSLKSRADSGATSHEDLARELQKVPLNKLDKGDLVEIATELGASLPEKAVKNDAIDAIWKSITREGKPRRAAPSGTKPATPFPVEEYAQKIAALKERGNAPDVSRAELEESLKRLQLDQLTLTQLHELAEEVSCPVNAKTTKPETLAAIERQILPAREMPVGATT